MPASPYDLPAVATRTMSAKVYDLNDNNVVDTCDALPYSRVSSKPTSFPPSTHTHPISQVTNLAQRLADKADANHAHTQYYTKAEMDEALDGKSPTSHTHETLVSQDELEDALEGKADVDHTHDEFYTKEQVDDIVSAPSGTHTHDNRYYTKAEIDSSLLGKAATSHTHDSRYYTKEQIDNTLSALGVEETPYEFLSASSQWTVTHNLGRHPSAVILNSSGELIHPSVSYPDSNTIVITHSSAITGRVYITAL